MWRKLRVYFIGVGLGLILTWALVLRNRNTRDLLAWTPNERIMAPLRADGGFDKPHNYVCLLECYNLSSLDMETLLETGKVNLSESKPRETPKLYRVEADLENDRIMWAMFSLGEADTALVDLGLAGTENACDCNP
jgi:hypothetical protein